jgi:hypothetical protein
LILSDGAKSRGRRVRQLSRMRGEKKRMGTYSSESIRGESLSDGSEEGTGREEGGDDGLLVGGEDPLAINLVTESSDKVMLDKETGDNSLSSGKRKRKGRRVSRGSDARRVERRMTKVF